MATVKKKSETTDFTPVSITLPVDLLPKIEKRITQLDVTRSQYFRRLAKQDLQTAGEPEKVAA